MKNLDADLCKEIILDNTFKIIPKEHRSYKLMVITGLLKNKNKPQILCFILLKYLDTYSYDKFLFI